MSLQNVIKPNLLGAYIRTSAVLGPVYALCFVWFSAWMCCVGALLFTLINFVAWQEMRKRRYTRSAIAVCGLWIGPAWCLLFSGGLASPMFVWLTCFGLMWGGLFGARAAVASGLISLALVLFSAVVNLDPVNEFSDPLNHWILCVFALGSSLAFSGLFVHLTMKSHSSDVESNHSRLRGILDSAADAILIADDTGTVIDVNSRAVATPKPDLIGSPIARWVPHISGECFDTRLLDTLSEGDGSRHEAPACRSDGSEFPAELSVSCYEEEWQLLYTIIVRDRSDNIRMQQQLEKARRLETVGELSAGVAHEINTPLQFIGSNTTFVKQSTEQLIDLVDKLCGHLSEFDDGSAAAWREDLKQNKYDFLKKESLVAVDDSLEGVDRVMHVVRAMKEFSHPGGDARESVDLNHSIESTATLSRNCWKYCAELELDLEEDLPTVQALGQPIKQTLLSLVVNAADAIEEKRSDGDPLGQITIRSRRGGDYAVIEVTDTGGGVPESVRERIFDPFFTTKPEGKGSGQGLAISYNTIVKQHGGRLDVDTEVGVGTTFRIQLPFEFSDLESADVAEESGEPVLAGTIS